MTLDASYNAGNNAQNYSKQGNAELVIASTGTVPSGGTFNVEDGGLFTLPFTVMSTTSGTISNYGITTIGTTIASGYTLADPSKAGLVKMIFNTIHGATTVNQVITCTSANIIENSVGTSTAGAKYQKITFANVGVVELVSVSTSHWLVKTIQTGITLSS